jgi:hypothetical protein
VVRKAIAASPDVWVFVDVSDLVSLPGSIGLSSKGALRSPCISVSARPSRTPSILAMAL